MITATQAVIGASVVGCVASAVFALARYAAIREGRWTSGFLAVFVVTVVIYGVVGLALARLGSGRSRRWALALAAPALVTSTVAALGTGMLGAAIGFGVVLLPAMAAYGTARGDGRWTSGFVAGMTSALIVGMLSFVGFTTTIYIAGGGSPTDQMLQEFHRSGMTDYTVWAIDDNLGGAVLVLGLLPVVGGAFAALGAQLGLASPPDHPRLSQTRPR